VSLGQLKVMSAIESCRTAALGGHVERCEDCAHTQIAYNSCRNRHCPKCQGAAAKQWLAEREAELLPVPYYGNKWVSCRPGFFLPVRVLSRLFRRLFLERLLAAHKAGRLTFFGDHAPLADARAFAVYLAPLRKTEWVVYAKRPFGGPEAVLAYLSRYTHRVAISNSRLIAVDDAAVTFKWKDYRAEGRERQKIMTLVIDEFIRRFLIHVLPRGFHRIRHYGLFASGTRADNIARARELLAVPAAQSEAADTNCAEANEPKPPAHPCPRCGGRMVIIERFERGSSPRYRPAAFPIAIRIDTS
jgi:hypothetical protein